MSLRIHKEYMPLAADAVQECLNGVAVGLLTPFDENLGIEHDKLAENAQDIYDAGIRTFLASANISEYHALSHDERIAVSETSINALPSDACVLAGVGGSTHDAQELIRAYDRIGVDAMMIMPPDHTYLHEQGLITYYRNLDAITDTPLVPYVRGFDPSVEYLSELTRIDGVIGIKYALEDPVKLGTAIASGSDDVVWVNGLAEPFAVAYWAENADGFSAGVSNFRPEIGLELYEALADGNWARARKLRNICLPYQHLRSETGQNSDIPGGISVSVVKKGLELAGLHGGHVREPSRALAPEEERRAEQLYEQLDAEIEQLIG